MKVDLVRDTIDKGDIDSLIGWLKNYPRLTMKYETQELEKQFSKWLGTKYTVFVNSGSSANLAMIYTMILSGSLKNKKVIVPALSWATTLAPIIQLGLEPILCDADYENLGMDPTHLKILLEEHKPSLVISANILGFPAHVEEIKSICDEHNAFLVVDNCESLGTKRFGRKLGLEGIMCTHSLYMGHHISTIEGGFVSTNNKDFYDLLKMVRSHGWSRDLDQKKKKELREKHNVNAFDDLYTFYVPGFNIRSTDLQAYLGSLQMKKLDDICEKRWNNFQLYQKNIVNNEWKITPHFKDYISNFAYPIFTRKRDTLVKKMKKAKIECRPLVAGSLSCHPAYKHLKNVGTTFADQIHNFGLYLPNNHNITEEEILYVCDVVNKVLGNG